MSETARPEVLHGWRIEAFPAGWDPSNPTPIKTVQVDNGITVALLPERFYFVVQTPAMLVLAETTAVVIELETEKAGVAVTSISGTGQHWLSYLGEVMAEIPTQRWVPEAVQKALAFMIDREVLATLGPLITELAISERVTDTSAASGGSGGGQRRRQITPEHLAEVAEVYLEALRHDLPPTRTVQLEFQVSHSTAAKWVGKARAAGFLPPMSEEP